MASHLAVSGLWPPCPGTQAEIQRSLAWARRRLSAMPTVGMPRHARSLGPALSQSVRSSPATRAPRVPVDHRAVSRAQRLPGAAHRGEMGDDTGAAPRPRSGRPALQAAASQATCRLLVLPTLKSRKRHNPRTNKTRVEPSWPSTRRQRSTAPAHMDLLGQLLPKSDTSSAGYAHMCKLWVSGIGGCLPISCPLRSRQGFALLSVRSVERHVGRSDPTRRLVGARCGCCA